MKLRAIVTEPTNISCQERRALDPLPRNALRKPWGRQTHRVMEPLPFMARLAALVPPPRHPLIRFHGPPCQ